MAGDTWIEEELDRFTVDARAHGIEYPFQKIYELPPGAYQIQLKGWDQDRPNKREDDLSHPMAEMGIWYMVR